MYYSQIRVDPTNPEIAYQGGAPFFKTVDGGKTWRQVPGIPHSDHHAIWINPKNSNHILLGNDGGIDVTYDQAETWEYVNTVPVGQFYAVSADMRKPYYVCGGLQDNGSWCGPSAVRSRERHPELRLVPRRRRRRFLHGQRSERLDDPLLGIAGRRDQPDRPAHRAIELDPSARAATGRSTRSAAGRVPGTEGMPPEQLQQLAAQFGFGGSRPTSCRRPHPTRTSASTGTRRSSCRRTTRGPSILAAIACSVRTIAARPGRRRRI